MQPQGVPPSCGRSVRERREAAAVTPSYGRCVRERREAAAVTQAGATLERAQLMNLSAQVMSTCPLCYRLGNAPSACIF